MEIREFLQMVLPWPDEGQGFINIHWCTPKPGGKPGEKFWFGKPAQTIPQFLKLRNWVLRNVPKSDIYMCLSQQAKTRTSKNGKIVAARSQSDVVALKAVWLDVDVKSPPKGYSTLAEALDAIITFVASANLPKPSALVHSGGGVHVYWAADKPMTKDEWLVPANRWKAAAIKYCLRCDAGVTIDSARVLRVPGTYNYKTDPPRPVILLG